MADDNDTIMDSGNLAEELERFDEDDNLSDLTATEAPKPDTMDFHVQMRGYTMSDFEEMVVRAAAEKLIGRSSRAFEEDVKTKACELLNEKISGHLEPITTEFFDQPILAIGYGSSKEPVTIRQYVGLVGREFLSQKVTADGKPAGPYDRGEPRINRIVGDVLERRFSTEISAAFSELKKDVSAVLNQKLDEAINAERERLSSRLEFDLKKSR